jgi:hypothetical protein
MNLDKKTALLSFVLLSSTFSMHGMFSYLVKKGKCACWFPTQDPDVAHAKTTLKKQISELKNQQDQKIAQNENLYKQLGIYMYDAGIRENIVQYYQDPQSFPVECNARVIAFVGTVYSNNLSIQRIKEDQLNLEEKLNKLSKFNNTYVIGSRIEEAVALGCGAVFARKVYTKQAKVVYFKAGLGTIAALSSLASYYCNSQNNKEKNQKPYKEILERVLKSDLSQINVLKKEDRQAGTGSESGDNF